MNLLLCGIKNETAVNSGGTMFSPQLSLLPFDFCAAHGGAPGRSCTVAREHGAAGRPTCEPASGGTSKSIDSDVPMVQCPANPRQAPLGGLIVCPNEMSERATGE